MLSKLSLGLLTLALLFGLSRPANSQGYWGIYSPGSGQPYVHPADTFPYSSLYYTPYYIYIAYYTPYWPGCSYGWWSWISLRR
jgi:hypothetical protein